MTIITDAYINALLADAIEHEKLGLLFPLKASMQADQINVDGKWVKLKPGICQ